MDDGIPDWLLHSLLHTSLHTLINTLTNTLLHTLSHTLLHDTLVGRRPYTTFWGDYRDHTPNYRFGSRSSTLRPGRPYLETILGDHTPNHRFGTRSSTHRPRKNMKNPQTSCVGNKILHALVHTLLHTLLDTLLYIYR